MTLGRLWAGRAYGTSTGNLFVKLEGEDASLTGTLHLNESDVGLLVFAIRGEFDGSCVRFTGEPENQMVDVSLGQLDATAVLNTRGELKGEWSTSVGSAGTFILFPHDLGSTTESSHEKLPEQLHTARHHFGAVEIDWNSIMSLADEIQRDFKSAEVVVTVVAGTEQSRFLRDFKTQIFNIDRATIIKLFVQEPEGSGVNRIAQLEFGPQINLVMTQGGDEAWVLGMLEKLKRSVRPLERVYTTNFKRLGFGINQFLLLSAIVYLPSLPTLRDRAILMAGVVAIVFGVTWLHNRFLPFAAIYLGQKPKGMLARIAPSAISWMIAVTAGIAATLLAAYLQGWFPLPLPR